MAISPAPTNALPRRYPSGQVTAARGSRGDSDAANVPVFTPVEEKILRSLEGTYRDIYTQALPEIETGRSVVLGITSAIRGEGRTSTALGLSLAIAQDMDVQVLLVELDLEHPTLAHDLSVPPQPGLVEVLAGRTDLFAALHRLPCGSIDLLTAGSHPRSASRVLRSDALRDLLTKASPAYPVTVLDMPPALSSSDIVPLSECTDAILVTARAGVTPTRLVSQAVERCAPGKVRGIVLNGHRSKVPSWVRLFV
jgi:Mrp family chromosome partitioning ATPase